MTAEEIKKAKKAIEQEHVALQVALQEELDAALAAQVNANTRVKAARQAIADAPRLHVPKKYPNRGKTAGRKLADAVVTENSAALEAERQLGLAE